MWDDLKVVGDENWVIEAIREGTLLAVADGSFIQELYPDVCSAGFVMGCSHGRGRIYGRYPEQSKDACAYRGELLGLMAIHLILAAANKLAPDLAGKADIYSDCLGAVGRVKGLPTKRIPSRCRHSDILKNIMLAKGKLSFECSFHHVRAHQDDHRNFNDLPRPAQLNCIADSLAKQAIRELRVDSLLHQESFPLEPVVVYAGRSKMLSDSSKSIRFWAHRKLARVAFNKLGILFPHEFDEVD